MAYWDHNVGYLVYKLALSEKAKVKFGVSYCGWYTSYARAQKLASVAKNSENIKETPLKKVSTLHK